MTAYDAKSWPSRRGWKSIGDAQHFSFLFCFLHHKKGTLQSIDGQPVDSQFVLASRSITTTAAAAAEIDGQKRRPAACGVQLFSRDGRYRFQVGQIGSDG